MSSQQQSLHGQHDKVGKQQQQQRRPHESTLGSLPGMDSCPPSGNVAFPQDPPSSTGSGTSLVPLPPPPPPPKTRSAGRALSPPRSTLSGGSTPPSTTVAAAAAAVAPLPPPPNLRRPPTASNSFKKVPPPPPPRVQTSTTDSSSTASASLADSLSPTNDQDAEDGNGDVLPWDAFPTAPPRLPLTTWEDVIAGNTSTTGGGSSLSLLARRQTHLPILVVSTESAERLAWRNGLQLVDMFQGIAQEMHWAANSIPPFRSVHKSLTLPPLQIRFLQPSELSPISYSDAHALLQSNAQILPQDGNVEQELVLLEDRVEELLQDPTSSEQKMDLDQVAKDAYQLTSPLDIPWLIRYRQALDSTTDALPADLIQSPPLILFVCSTEEPTGSPISVLQELYNAPHDLPDSFRNGLLDPTRVRREVLVLHDAMHGPANLQDPATAEPHWNQLRSSLQSQFGPHAQMLRINTVSSATAQALQEQETNDLWKGQGKLGNRLGVNDRVLIRRYLQSLVTTSLLPAMEQRIAYLNAVVSERKKGVRNLVKSFWRKPKEETAPVSSGAQVSVGEDGVVVKYRYDSIENQTRLLADTLFLIQDYDAALSTYRLIRDDFKADKAHAHYANVQEMIGLCLYCLDPFLRSKEIFSCFESALLSYTRAAEEERTQRMTGKDPSSRPSYAPHATRQGTRLCLLMATANEYLTQSRELEVADLLASASSHESSLGAAVLLEQASAYYFESRMFRKYAFHMLMSGHMFRTAGQDHHAFRCFTSALYVYRHGQWPELHGHLKSALAAQLYAMGRMSVALLLYGKLVSRSGKVSAKSQQKFLDHIVEICTDHAKKATTGAGRMAAPPTLTTRSEREAFCNAEMEKIVQVIRYTKEAGRVLELPYLDLPKILDSTVRVWTHAEEHFLTGSRFEDNDLLSAASAGCLGKPTKGSDDVWKELEVLTHAEIQASITSQGGLDEAMKASLTNIDDPAHRAVVAHMDREKQSRSLLERSRSKGKVKPSVRARGEPIFCDVMVQNPLNVAVEVTELQLVARLVDAEDTICTSQEAIEFRGPSASEPKTWTFASTGNQEFSVGAFSRIQAKDKKSSTPASSNPFFVVTKSSLKLLEGEQKEISLGLCPLVDGNLEILGVRFRLADKVWVNHPLDVPGPLLQDTQSNRANRVRGESVVLKSLVEGEMPCLTAEVLPRGEMTGGQSLLLQGQVSEWTLRLSNVGNAPASGVCLKTNLPWINIVSETEGGAASTAALARRAVSHCVGPSGTLMSLPVGNSGVLAPNETVEIPIQVRASSNGQQELYMLLRYKEAGSMGRTRWLRHKFDVPVYPSISFETRLMPSSMNSNEQIMAMEVTNGRTDHPINPTILVDQWKLATRHYELIPMPGQFDSLAADDPTTSTTSLELKWQERVTLYYRLVPRQEEAPCLLSECPLGGTCTPTPNQHAPFLCLERAHEGFSATVEQHEVDLLRAEHAGDQHPRSIASIRRANTADSGLTDVELDEAMLSIDHPTCLNRLCPSSLGMSILHVGCQWRAIVDDRAWLPGVSYQTKNLVRPRTVDANTLPDAFPVTVLAEHARVVQHALTQGPARVPLQVTFQNASLDDDISFTLHLGQSKKNPNHHRLEWIGSERMEMNLKANESQTLSLEALIPHAGWYNLQDLSWSTTTATTTTSPTTAPEDTFLQGDWKMSGDWMVCIADTSTDARAGGKN
eukprot:Nitzschia sp. Nitz4//scaffold304_size22322//3923//9284//NITZ4_008571-RA/size22322-snap-gene-0.0-mRNA-1//1//CDS//3329547070//5482//frame0